MSRDLDQIYESQSLGMAEDREVLEGRLVQKPDAMYVKIDGEPKLWGPVFGIGQSLGDGILCAIVISQDGKPWVVGGGGGGTVGPPGPQGPTGPAGPAGPTGPQGVKGDPGIQGPPGATGSTGPAGSTGPPGPTGTRGSLWYLGEVEPPPDQPGQQPHDIYMDNSGEMYAVDEDGDWYAVGMNIRGPEGEMGPQGPQGPTGATGSTGSQGPAGATGATGPPGAVLVFEQLADPGPQPVGALWIVNAP